MTLPTTNLPWARTLLCVLPLFGLAGCSDAPPDMRLLAVSPDLPPGALAGILREAGDGPFRLALAPGRYILDPIEFTDPTCGNCQDADEAVPGTLGMRISGRGIEIVGTSADEVVIETRAGYGLLFEDCEGCLLRGVTVTGGVRDPDGRATNGAIVVRRSTVGIEECRIADNIGDSATVAAVVVGISGVVGREGANFTLERCRIERNSWDGVALYRGARAAIRDNVVDGVDRASGARVGGGRGVGIGLTWDARAEITGNRVTNYWKGIGVFVNAQAEIRHNVVEDILTWGIALWKAGDGRAAARIEENVIYWTGACGAMLDPGFGHGDGPGTFRGNAVVRTAQDERYDSGEPYCPQRAIARLATPEGFLEEGNLLLDNRHRDEGAPDLELESAEFRSALAPLLERLRSGTATAGSTFVREEGR